jgi:hypothetical protein
MTNQSLLERLSICQIEVQQTLVVELVFLVRTSLILLLILFERGPLKGILWSVQFEFESILNLFTS